MRGVVAVTLATLAHTGCGRVGFDASPRPDPPADASPPIDAPAQNNIVFVSSATYSGALGGLAGGDALCATLATAAGLGGRYVAWLSTSTTDAASRLVDAIGVQARGWVRPDGRPVVDTVDDLLAGTIYYPIRIDEQGGDLAPESSQHVVFTGTTPGGTLDASESECSDWTVAGSAESYVQGDQARTTTNWTSNGVTACTTPAHIYCFGIDHDTPLPPIVPAIGRRAFVSSEALDTSGTLSDADALCAGEATQAQLTGTFLALLATTANTAASRFDPAPGPWTRVDGVPLAATGDDVLAFALDTSLDVEADGNRQASQVWTGAASPSVVATGSDDCMDWTTGSGSATGDTGWSSSSTSGFDDDVLPCDTANPVYCFEQ